MPSGMPGMPNGLPSGLPNGMPNEMHGMHGMPTGMPSEMDQAMAMMPAMDPKLEELLMDPAKLQELMMDPAKLEEIMDPAELQALLSSASGVMDPSAVSGLDLDLQAQAQAMMAAGEMPLALAEAQALIGMEEMKKATKRQMGPPKNVKQEGGNAIPSLTCKAVIRAAMNERVRKLDRLSRISESSLTIDQRNEKKKLMTLEKNRRAAQLSREKKKRYVSSLEARVGMLAKHLANLECVNNQLRAVLASYGDVAIQLPPSLCMEFAPVPEENPYEEPKVEPMEMEDKEVPRPQVKRHRPDIPQPPPEATVSEPKKIEEAHPAGGPMPFPPQLPPVEQSSVNVKKQPEGEAPGATMETNPFLFFGTMETKIAEEETKPAGASSAPPSPPTHTIHTLSSKKPVETNPWDFFNNSKAGGESQQPGGGFGNGRPPSLNLCQKSSATPALDRSPQSMVPEMSPRTLLACQLDEMDLKN